MMRIDAPGASDPGTLGGGGNDGETVGLNVFSEVGFREIFVCNICEFPIRFELLLGKKSTVEGVK